MGRGKPDRKVGIWGGRLAAWARRGVLALGVIGGVVGAAGLVGVAGCGNGGAGSGGVLLNVSYDPTRELYEAINPAFVKTWREKTGQELEIRMSHGGSGKQAQAVLAGLEADVVTLALAPDIDVLAGKGLVALDWAKALPANAAPYTSTIVLVVRAGNPKGIKDWGDLARDGVAVISPDPRSSGGARWNYLAAWAHGRKAGGSDAAALEFVTKVFRNVTVLDSGARAATATFQRGEGDVLVAWENEALLLKEQGKGAFEVVVPQRSILAEPPVAVLKAADGRGMRAAAEAYLKFLYTAEGQEIAARNHYRPRDEAVLAKHAGAFPAVELVTVEGEFGGWEKAVAEHFGRGGKVEKVLGARGN